jgi:hypothetical protein
VRQDIFYRTCVGQKCRQRGYCVLRTFAPQGNQCKDCGAEYDGQRASLHLRREGSAILRGAGRRDVGDFITNGARA